MTYVMVLSQTIIFLPILVAVLIYIVNKEIMNYLIFVSQFIMSLILVKVWEFLLSNGPIQYTLGGWQNKIGIEIKIDNLSLLFITMAVIMWWVVLIYAWGHKKSDFKFWFFLLFLEGCFIAFVQSNDLFTFFVLIEIITILSAILILYKKDGLSIKAALYYLLFNSFGMVIYLFGVMLIYVKVGSLNIGEIKSFLLASHFSGSDFSLIHVSFACLFVAMCVKAALFPVYDWLPRAHTAAPAYISALLSGLLVKSGIYGLIRILDIFDISSIMTLMFYLGFFTAISGIVFAISQKDIKAILAFHTISQIGLIVMSISLNNEVGLLGAYLHLFNHFLFKSLLFLGVGIIVNTYGFRKVNDLKGIFWTHPILSMCMFIGILSITGAPLFLGFLSKSVMKYGMLTSFQQLLFKIISLGTMISFIKFSKIFFGRSNARKPIAFSQMLGVLILTIGSMFTYFTELKLASEIFKINGHRLADEVMKQLHVIDQSNYKLTYWFEYLFLLFIAYVMYRFINKPDALVWTSIRHFRIKFQDAVVLLIVYLLVVLMII